jgi:dTDP-4-dehydrorhamnose reductase
MRIVVLGRRGQLASALIERGGGQVIALGRPALDLADRSGIGPAIRAARPDVVVCAGAYTAVDQAERERDRAFAVNAHGAGEVARVARWLDVPLIHLSTDYVFDGMARRPYLESDRPAPLGVYGASKLAGEQAVLAAYPAAVIVRTAWVYGPFGGNFVRTMLHLAARRAEIDVVADQIGNPTSVLDLADTVLAMARGLMHGARAGGVFHVAGRATASWADLAEAVFAISRAQGGQGARVRRIATCDYPTAARRPLHSVLDCGALTRAFGMTLPGWRDSLPLVVARLRQTMEVA